ncbi:MAG: 16S rRNA (cytidine(1402)-2'-O)-methyltransferase [Syntrophales bacterium]|nr:16S rRNA (cytidine(1402)-2'-O)-methyltransferase [Syntrophales bacterium]
MDKGILYVVATPIGNLEDITYRAVRVLREVNLVAAEDTRRTRLLLDAYGIRTPLTSLHDHNEKSKTPGLVGRMERGEAVAYCSDAGTPGVSDPGYRLVCATVAAGIRVVPIPGPSAAIAALSASGLPMNSFLFQAFLPARRSQRRAVLTSLREERRTLVFYESPRRLAATLTDMGDIFGDRRVVIARELTKIYEEFLRGTLVTLQRLVQERPLKGEVTIIVAGAEPRYPDFLPEDIRERLRELAERDGLSVRDRVRRVAAETGLKRHEVYRYAVEDGESS